MSRLELPEVGARPRSSASRSVLPAVLGLGTARPAHRYAQEDLAAFLAQNRNRRDTRRIAALFRRAGVRTRGSVLPDFSPGSKPRLFAPDRSPSTAQRMEVFAEEAPVLGEEAALRALEAAGQAGGDVTHVVWISCTGFVAPGPDRTLGERLGLPASVKPLLIGFQGCSAGITGLRTAAEIVRGQPDARVLVVSVELGSLHFQRELTDDDLRGHALFADGAGAAVVGASGEDSAGPTRQLAIGSAASYLLPGTAEQMTWTVADTGFLMRLSARVPLSLEEALPGLIRDVVDDAASVRHWAVHPGGPAVLDRVAGALALPAEALADSRAVLRDEGNLSSATIFFVLERIARRAEPGRGLALAFGPGLTAEALAFRC